MIDKIIPSLHTLGWAHIPGFLHEKELESINCFFENQKQDFKTANIGKGSQKMRVEEIRGDRTLWLDPINPPKEFFPIMTFLNQLKIELNRQLFLGLKEFECHLAYYPVGALYKKHSDLFEKDSSRALSFIFYLHSYWGEDDGGELILYDNNGSVVQEILPLPGSFACFVSSEFPHEVKPGKKERMSLTGWMHTKIIY
jgi:SM-20-related protein